MVFGVQDFTHRFNLRDGWMEEQIVSAAPPITSGKAFGRFKVHEVFVDFTANHTCQREYLDDKEAAMISLLR